MTQPDIILIESEVIISNDSLVTEEPDVIVPDVVTPEDNGKPEVIEPEVIRPEEIRPEVIPQVTEDPLNHFMTNSTKLTRN